MTCPTPPEASEVLPRLTAPLPDRRATYRITTAWCSEEGENPWLVSAYDQCTEDAWNGEPVFFTEAVAKVVGEIRIVNLFVNYDRIEELFAAVDVEAHVDAGGAR